MADPILWTPGQTVAGPDTDALAAQHGGLKSQQARTPTKEERQRYEDAGVDLDQNPITRYYFADGTYAELMVAPNNTDFTVVDYKPSQKFQQQHPANQTAQPPKEEPNPADPTRMRRWNPTTTAWEDAGPNQPEIDRRAEAARQAARQAASDANAAAAQARADAAAAASANKATYITTQDGTVYEVAPGKPPVAIINGAKPGQIVNAGNGKLLQVGQDGTVKVIYDNPTAEPKQDKDGQWYVIEADKDGKQNVRYITPSGKSTLPGPSMPEFVLGHSQDALRAYKDQLNARVASGDMTQTAADTAFDDALRMAQTTINEATIQNSKNQSELNASTNLANSRLQASTSGFNSALDFVGKLNAALPSGSKAGAKAFVALLGLQAMQAQQSGAYSGIVPGSQSLGSGPSTYQPPATGASPMTPAQASALSPANVQATTGAFGQAAAAVSAQPSAPPPATAAATPSAPQPAAGVPAAAQGGPAALPEATPGGGPPAPPPIPARGNESPDDILTVQTGDGRQVFMTRANWDASDPTAKAAATVVNAENGAAFRQHTPTLNPGDTGYQNPLASGDIPPASPIPSAMPPDYGQGYPGGPTPSVLPAPPNVWQPGGLPDTSSPRVLPSADTGTQFGPPGGTVTVIDPSTRLPITLPRGVYNIQSDDWKNQHGQPSYTPGADPNVTRDPTVDPSSVDPQSRMAPQTGLMMRMGLQQPSDQPSAPSGAPMYPSRTMGTETIPAPGYINYQDPDNPQAMPSAGDPNRRMGTETIFRPGTEVPMPQGMAPQPDYPVLAQYGQSPQTPQMPSMEYPALLHSQAAATPPWRLTSDQIAQMQAAGVPASVVWSVPGSQVA